jgi:hypothetical protein
MGRARFFPCLRTLVAFFSLLSSSPGLASETPWDGIVSTVHQVAEVVRRGPTAEPWRVARVRRDLEQLLESPEQITSFLEFAYGRGLLHLDGFRRDLEYLSARLRGADASHVSDRLVSLGFARFAIYLADVPKRETVLTDVDLERSPEPAPDASPTYPVPGHASGATLEERASRSLDALERDYAAMASKLDAFVQTGERVERRAWWGHTTAVMTLAALSLYHGFELLEVGSMTPKELIALMGGIWAANAGGYYLLWQWSGILEWLKPVVARTQYKEVKEAWQNLMTALPVLAARTAAAAARDKYENPATRMDAYSMAPLEALLETKSRESTEQLFTLALQYLENGHLALARRAFREIDRRTPQEQLRTLTDAVERAFRAKRTLESRVFRRQLSGMLLRLAAVGVALWAVNLGVRWLAPEWVRAWAKVPTAVFAAIGVNRILRFLWRPQKRERVDRYAQSDREALLEAFRELMRADPTGEVLRRIAVNRSTSATQAIVTELAVDAMAEVHSGRVTLEMYRLWRDTLASSNENGARVQHLIRRTFEQHRGCLRALVDVSSSLGEQLRPFVARTDATVPEGALPSSLSPTH